MAAHDTFTVKELQPQAAQALGCADSESKLNSVRYELAQLRAKGLVESLIPAAIAYFPKAVASVSSI